jgi:hypothetical protein
MAISKVTFTEWLPDQPGVVGALTNARNVFPKAVGYGPFPEEEDYSGDASEALNSVAAGTNSAGDVKIFAGGETKLFLLQSSDFSLNDVSGTTYTATDRWNFVQFGNFMIAANGKDTLQYADMATTTISFADLDASAPTAKLVTVVRDFVVAGNTNTSSSQVIWSGLNNPNTWGNTAITQADNQIVPDGGEVKGITGGEFGLVLLEKSIVRMSYVGSPIIFQFDNISRNLGCFESNSVVQWQGVTYFLADDGFYSCNGETIEAIGAEKINRYFWSTVQDSAIGTMSTAVDPFRALVMWGYPSIDGDYRVLAYHIPTKKWSFAETNVNRIADITTPAVTLEDLDNFSASLDALDASLDSRQWLGGYYLVAGVRAAKIVSFSGANKTARITSADLETGANMSMVTLVKPIIENGSASVAVDSRFNLSEAVSFGDATAADSENRVGIRSLGRYHRVRVIPSGNWTTAIGFEVDIQQAGGR